MEIQTFDVNVFVERDTDKHYVIYLGGGAQLIQNKINQACYVGGLGTNYKR